MYKALFFSLLLTVILAACSPSADAARQVYVNTESRIRDGVAELQSFEKTNGQAMDTMGQKVYVLHYTAVIHCIKDETGWLIFGEPCVAGKTFRDDGSMYFQNSERGWIGEDGEIY